MRVLVTGAGGQLAADVVAAMAAHEVTGLRRDQLDICDSAAVSDALESLDPEVVINTAAFHDVDRSESEPEHSFLVNAAAPQRLAAACDHSGALLVHVSTDYVFGGRRQTPYPEHHPVDPVNVYGASKAAGEMAVRCTTDRHVIVRTTGLYGHAGMTSRHGNFVELMLRLAAEGQPLEVVDGQTLTPSYTRDVAETVARLVDLGARGTFHVTNSGACTWYEFAAEVFRRSGTPARLSPTDQHRRPTPARRPVYSVLAHNGLRSLGLPDLRPWQEALESYLTARTRYVEARRTRS